MWVNTTISKNGAYAEPTRTVNINRSASAYRRQTKLLNSWSQDLDLG